MGASQPRYSERRSTLVPGVVWRIENPAGGAVLPDGCMDLIWLGEQLVVAGPDTAPYLSERSAGSEAVGLRFAPGIAPLVLGVPAHELRDLRVPLEELWTVSEVGRLSEQVFAGHDAGSELQQIAAARLQRGEPVPDNLAALVTMLRDGTRVSAVADQLNLSERQLHRRSLHAFGYGPKVLSRILRFVRASTLVRSGMPRAEAAALTGYADQPHMTREFRLLTQPSTNRSAA